MNETDDKRTPFKGERKTPARELRRMERRDIIGEMNKDLDWEKLCALASAEVEATLQALPPALRAQAEKLPVTLDPQPNQALQEDGIEIDTLGLFTGAEFVEENDIPMPPQIILFLANLWDFAERSEKEYCEEIRTTFLHELGHYFGLNEDDLDERGLQ